MSQPNKNNSDNSRPLGDTETQHPLAWKDAQVLAETQFDDTTDSILIAAKEKRRVLELFDDYEWLDKTRALSWQEFEALATKTKRPDWPKAAKERLEHYGWLPEQSTVWIGEHLSLDPWLLGFEITFISN